MVPTLEENTNTEPGGGATTVAVSLPLTGRAVLLLNGGGEGRAWASLENTRSNEWGNE
jgi:hypothetical protein